MTMTLEGTLDAEVQNPVHLYSLFMFILSEPEKVDSGSRTPLELALQDQVLALAVSAPATF